MEWIDVNDILPEKGETILVSDKNGEVFFCDYDLDDSLQKTICFIDLTSWNSRVGYTEKVEAFYWMPIPKAPEQ